MEYNNLDNFFNDILGVKEDIYIWGTGVYGDILGQLFDKWGRQWDGYYDNYPNSKTIELNGKKIFHAQEVSLKSGTYILSMRNYQSVYNQLIENGIAKEHIITFSSKYLFEQMTKRVIESAEFTEKITQFKGIHTGKRCLIIGNGPSLKLEDLEKSKKLGFITMASNMIFNCFEQTSWRPDYYFFTDVMGMRSVFSEKEKLTFVLKNCEYAFTRTDGLLFDYRNVEDIRNLMYFDFVYSKDEEQFDFSEDCSKQIYIGYTVTYAMLQMAVYMGFKEIYLIGMDHNFSVEKASKDGNVTVDETVQDHAKILGGTKVWGVADVYKITCAYNSAKQYAEEHNIQIYNATRGGKLEVFKRIHFDSIK